MNARQKIHQVHLQEWTIRFAEQKASGLTVKQWCEQNHYSFHSYNYWKRLLKEEVVDQTLPDIVPVTLSAFSDPGSSLETDPSAIRAIRTNRANCTNDTDIVNLQFNGISVGVSSSVSEDFLAKLLRAIRYA